jgi:hypothetical protein
MGNYTAYKLLIKPYKDDVIAALRQDSEEAAYALTDDGSTSESCKWYEHEADLKRFSKRYPDTLFTLLGSGEEPGDIWRLYVKNGKKQKIKAKLVFDEYNEDKLR